MAPVPAGHDSGPSQPAASAEGGNDVEYRPARRGGWRPAFVCAVAGSGRRLSEQADHHHGRLGAGRHHRRHRAALRGSGRAQHGAAHHHRNRPAAAGALAAAAVQNAVPDGTMLLVFSGSQHATVAAMGSAPYEPVKGFSFITVLFNSVVAFVVPPDNPARTLAELFDLGRKRSGGLSMGTPGLGSPSHLLGARVALAANAPLQSIHYRGGAPLADVLTGRVDFAVVTLSTSRAFLADKRLRALALDAVARWSELPDVPVLAEIGYGKEKVANWFGVAAPPGCRRRWCRDCARNSSRHRAIRSCRGAWRRTVHDRHQHLRGDAGDDGRRGCDHGNAGEDSRHSLAIGRREFVRLPPRAAGR